MKNKLFGAFVVYLLFGNVAKGVSQDFFAMYPTDTVWVKHVAKPKLNYTPGLLIASTGMLLNSSSMKAQQLKFLERSNFKTTKLDNYLPIANNGLVYLPAWLGLKPEHSFKQRFVTSAMANSINLALVLSLKGITNQLRPYNNGTDSYPSGHTAVAFVGAEHTRMEYRKHGPWLGVLSYTMAGTTGLLRVSNRRHWWADVVTGAGVGILSTQAAYALLPWAEGKLLRSKNEKGKLASITPYALPKGAGVSLAFNL
jgi:hypothetical protein